MSLLLDPKKLVHVLVFVLAPLWVVTFPCCFVLWLLLLPWSIFWSVARWVFQQDSRESGLRITAHGPAEAAAKGVIVMVHGWPDNGSMWVKQVRAWSGAGYRCLVVDLPGMGEGVPPAPFPGFSIPELADMLAEAIDKETACKSVILCGHDWGAVIARLTHSRHPQLVERLVLVDVYGVGDTVEGLVFFFGYQAYLAVAYLMGGVPGTLMTWVFLALVGYKERPFTAVSCAVNYHYPRFLLSMFAGALSGGARTELVPVFFAYGKRKGIHFHSRKCLSSIRGSANSRVVAYPEHHWVTHSCSPQLNRDVLQWLAA